MIRPKSGPVFKKCGARRRQYRTPYPKPATSGRKMRLSMKKEKSYQFPLAPNRKKLLFCGSVHILLIVAVFIPVIFSPFCRYNIPDNTPNSAASIPWRKYCYMTTMTVCFFPSLKFGTQLPAIFLPSTVTAETPVCLPFGFRTVISYSAPRNLQT